MQMTFLQLVQRFRQETNYANTGPSSVVGQVGDHARAVSWVQSAYEELQNRHLWRWLRKGFSLTTDSGANSYTYTDGIDSSGGSAISRFKTWAITDPWNPPKCYLQSSGSGAEYWLTYVPWEYFRTVYQIGHQEAGAPAHITVSPDDKIYLGPTPNDAYVVSGEYHKSAQILTVNSDTPEMPTDFHMLIVYRAMEDYGLFEPAQEVMNRAQIKGRRLLRQLEMREGEKMRKAGPLA
jgi:hypothetical protein